MDKRAWGEVLRSYWALVSHESGMHCGGPHKGCRRCPGWYVVGDEILLCTDWHTKNGAHLRYWEFIPFAAEDMRNRGLLDLAPCGSKTCTACFMLLDNYSSSALLLKEMVGEERAVHVVIFAAIEETL